MMRSRYIASTARSASGISIHPIAAPAMVGQRASPAAADAPITVKKRRNRNGRRR